jgi:hypothetical protein
VHFPVSKARGESASAGAQRGRRAKHERGFSYNPSHPLLGFRCSGERGDERAGSLNLLRYDI